MKKIEIQYVNEPRFKKDMSGLAFIAFVCLGYIIAVGAVCGYLWVTR